MQREGKQNTERVKPFEEPRIATPLKTRHHTDCSAKIHWSKYRAIVALHTSAERRVPKHQRVVSCDYFFWSSGVPVR